jgi:hypothetical protein
MIKIAQHVVYLVQPDIDVMYQRVPAFRAVQRVSPCAVGHAKICLPTISIVYFVVLYVRPDRFAEATDASAVHVQRARFLQTESVFH